MDVDAESDDLPFGAIPPIARSPRCPFIPLPAEEEKKPEIVALTSRPANEKSMAEGRPLIPRSELAGQHRGAIGRGAGAGGPQHAAQRGRARTPGLFSNSLPCALSPEPLPLPAPRRMRTIPNSRSSYLSAARPSNSSTGRAARLKSINWLRPWGWQRYMPRRPRANSRSILSRSILKAPFPLTSARRNGCQILPLTLLEE